MSLEVRQLVLRARVQDESDEDDDDAAREDEACGGGEEADACEDKESLKEEILAECRTWLLEQLRALRER